MSDDAAHEDLDAVYRVVVVASVEYSFADAMALVTLTEAEGERRLTLPMAQSDAAALFHAAQRTVGRRPSTGELVAVVLGELQSDIIAVRIGRREEGVYFAELDLMTPRGRRCFDARPSDAMTWALRQAVPAPLLVRDELLGG